jgi:serine/threonine protein kinase
MTDDQHEIIDERFQILGVIGVGGTSSVLKARHRLMDKIVAVKILKLQLASDQTWLARFQKEAQAATVLKHPGIVEVHSFGITDNGCPYFVMDYVEGKSLHEILNEEGRLDTERSLRLFEQICAALSHAHKHNMVHRDLKPANIMIVGSAENERAMLLDFGMVKIITAESEAEQVLTRTNMLIGTPAYMSPEQCHKQALSPASDIYSLACVLYEMLTGKPLFAGDSALQIMYAHTSEAPVLSDLPKGLRQTLGKALEQDPANRYASVEDFAAAVANCRGEKVLAKSGSPRRKISWTKLSPLRKVAIALTALVTIASVIAALVMPSLNRLGNNGLNQETVVESPDQLVNRANDLAFKGGEGNWTESFGLYQQALEMIEKGQPCSTPKGFILKKLGNINEKLSAPGKALSYYQQAIECLNQPSATMQAERASVFLSMSQIYLDRKDIEQAMKAARFAKEACKDWCPIQEQAWMNYQTGTTLMHDKKLAAAEKELRLAVKRMLSREGVEHVYSAAFEQRLAECLIIAGNYNEAEKSAARELELLDSSPYSKTSQPQPGACFVIASAYFGVGRDEDGLRWQRRGYKLARANGNSKADKEMGTILCFHLRRLHKDSEAAATEAADSQLQSHP